MAEHVGRNRHALRTRCGLARFDGRYPSRRFKTGAACHQVNQCIGVTLSLILTIGRGNYCIGVSSLFYLTHRNCFRQAMALASGVEPPFPVRCGRINHGALQPSYSIPEYFGHFTSDRWMCFGWVVSHHRSSCLRVAPVLHYYALSRD